MRILTRKSINFQVLKRHYLISHSELGKKQLIHREFLFIVSEGVESTNAALDTSDADKLLESMAVPELAIHSVIADCKGMYLEKLQEALEAKKSQGNQQRQLDVLINCTLGLSGIFSNFLCIC